MPAAARQVRPADSQGGLAQMLAQQGGSKEIVEAARQLESMPGGPELLYTFAAEEMMKGIGIPKGKAKKVRLYCIGGKVVSKARGGMASKAEEVRQAGQDGDEILLHVTPGELNVLKGAWGEPEINPDTGLPQYGFFKKLWKKVKKVVKKVVKSKAFQIIAPIALSVFAPGLGTAIGGALGMTGTTASVVGNAIVRGGLGAITGGKKGLITGALAGAVSGGLGSALGAKLGLTGRTADVVGSALIRGGGSALTGEGFMPGAVTGGLEAFMQMRPEQIAGGLKETFTGLAPGAAGPPLPLLKGLGRVAGKYALPALGLAAVSGALSGAGAYEAEGPPPGLESEGFGESLPLLSMNRKFRGLPNAEDYFTYGQPGAAYSGQSLFIDPADPFPVSDASGAPVEGPTGLGPMGQLSEEQLRGAMVGRGMPWMAQRGGEVDYWEQNEDVFSTVPTASRRGGRHVRGPGSGRSDDIEARLSDGEYVFDAESVALLGDGSGDMGARRLDEMRRNLRKHKGKNLSQGKFSHKAKTPDQYMRRTA